MDIIPGQREAVADHTELSEVASVRCIRTWSWPRAGQLQSAAPISLFWVRCVS